VPSWPTPVTAGTVAIAVKIRYAAKGAMPPL
jgi:hypothetical protein